MSNRLAREKSPYLLQHKDNPVDWFPWGEEAFEKARAENKPIFLSIGYATCHWCHVMEHESFEDEAIAGLMNEAFVNIKVDREERPDIDATYMTVCQLINGHGGWPLSIIMNADKEPFFAATYIPKEARFNRIGLRQLIPGVRGMWQHEPERIKKAIEQIKKGFGQSQEFSAGPFPGTEAVDLAAGHLLAGFDEEWGGFSNAPKFPSPHNLMFLLRQYHHTKNDQLLHAAAKTLTQMRLGGLWDHVGFGFHRYSTDREWLLPHFEKMLYDQALLMMAYTEAWQLTQNPLFHQTVDEIAEYIERDLMSPDGAFFSAEDADSEGEEGKFYVWNADELRELLLKDFDFLEDHLGVMDDGNFEDEATKQRNGQNILHLKNELNEEELKRWNSIRTTLFDARSKRIRPLLDDKILTDWNALMIAAFAKAGAVFQNEDFIQLAEQGFQFLEKYLWVDGQLLHRFKDGEAEIPAFADDYQSMIWAALELYKATFESKYLAKARSLMEQSLATFWDDENGGFFLSADDTDQPLGRQKQIFDGAIPSANSIGFLNLLKLGRITGNTEFDQKAHQLGEFFSHELLRSGASITMSMMALQFQYHDPGEIVLAEGDQPAPDITRLLQTHFLPSKIVLKKSPSQNLDTIAPFTTLQKPDGSTPLVYVCRNFTCEKPLRSITELNNTIRS